MKLLVHSMTFHRSLEFDWLLSFEANNKETGYCELDLNLRKLSPGQISRDTTMTVTGYYYFCYYNQGRP